MPHPASFVRLALLFLGASAAESKPAASDKADDVTRLPAFNVTGERLEDFGFRVSPGLDEMRSNETRRIYTPVVDVVLPNTAGAKAGIRPGDRILTSDGQPTATDSFSAGKWRGIQKKKWDEVATGKADVTWTLQVETAETLELRTLTLQFPTPAPHWGSTAWRAPQDRVPVVLSESGPLAERAQQILNNGVWVLLRGIYVHGFNLPTDAAHPNFLCYQWTLWSGSTGHRIYVSQQRGRTDIIFEMIAREQGSFFSSFLPTAAPDRNLSSATTVFAIDSRTYLTSPSGDLERAWRLSLIKPQQEIPREAARAGFAAEVDFWLNKVGKVSPLWPLGVIGEPAEK